MIHGTPERVVSESINGQLTEYSAVEFAEWLKNDPEYHGGNIRLLSCNNGHLDNGFAQQLANELQVEVMAPTETLWVNKNGEMFVSDSDVLAELWEQGLIVRQTGIWRTFKPERK